MDDTATRNRKTVSKKPTLYKLLQVDSEAETGLIRQAYLFLEAKHSASGDEEALKEVTEAWKVLSDDHLRAAYDESLLPNYLRCSFCGKNQDHVETLIAGPGVNMCNECVELTNEIINDKSFQGNPDEKCSFCGKTQATEDTLRVISGPGVYICAECVGLCNEIIADREREKQERKKQKELHPTAILELGDQSKTET